MRLLVCAKPKAPPACCCAACADLQLGAAGSDGGPGRRAAAHALHAEAVPGQGAGQRLQGHAGVRAGLVLGERGCVGGGHRCAGLHSAAVGLHYRSCQVQRPAAACRGHAVGCCASVRWLPWSAERPGPYRKASPAHSLEGVPIPLSCLDQPYRLRSACRNAAPLVQLGAAGGGSRLELPGQLQHSLRAVLAGSICGRSDGHSCRTHGGHTFSSVPQALRQAMSQRTALHASGPLLQPEDGWTCKAACCEVWSCRGAAAQRRRTVWRIVQGRLRAAARSARMHRQQLADLAPGRLTGQAEQHGQRVLGRSLGCLLDYLCPAWPSGPHHRQSAGPEDAQAICAGIAGAVAGPAAQ